MLYNFVILLKPFVQNQILVSIIFLWMRSDCGKDELQVILLIYHNTSHLPLFPTSLIICIICFTDAEIPCSIKFSEMNRKSALQFKKTRRCDNADQVILW